VTEINSGHYPCEAWGGSAEAIARHQEAQSLIRGLERNEEFSSDTINHVKDIN